MREQYTRLFLLSHMRACTSLAGHILGSHPRVNGYFELHISYQDASALDKQLEVYQRYETLKQDSCYLFDKLLHNDYALDLSLAGLVDSRLLVSLMTPERTIRSIVHLFSGKASDEPYASADKAARYYIERVQWLSEFCRTAGKAYHYYDAELFQQAPQVLLARLTQWLALDSPLSGEYQLFSQTGKERRGDSSALIRSGRIGRDRTDYSHIGIPADLLAEAVAAYRQCRATIIESAADSVIAPLISTGDV